MGNITYEKFIQNILNTRGRHGCGDEYYEKHHVLPRCMGGTDKEDNLIDLFAKEHFVAHKLLALENPKNAKLQYAWWCMCSCKEYNGKRIYDISAEDFEEARVRCSSFLKNRVISEDTRRKQKELALKGENHPWYGKHHTEKTKMKMKANHADVSGEKNPMYGVHRSGENSTFYGKHHTEETKIKISKSRKGKCAGKNNSNYGKPRSEEVKKKISESLKGKYIGDKHPRATILIQLDMDNQLIKVWEYMKLASKELNINVGCISQCANGLLKSASGYHWKYLYDNKLKNGEIIPGAITLGLITEEEALKQLEQNSKCKGDNNDTRRN